ncbi:MAG: TetR/AcrR family transcriptional regulator [Candidatus Onthomonas sp.]
MNTPHNAKSAASVTAIKQAFLELAQQKPCRKISVIELCKKAGVNRTTFYAHFADLYDVVAALESDFFQKVTSEVLPAGDNAGVLASRDTMLRILRCIKEHEQLYRIYLPYLSETRITRELTGYVRERYVIEASADSPNGRQEQAYCFEFCKQGTIGILSKWITEGCAESEENVAQWLEDMLKRCIQSGQEKE